MMKETTIKAIEILKERFGNDIFTERNLSNFYFNEKPEYTVSLSTLRKHKIIMSVAQESWNEMTLEEVATRLNELEGEDNWYDATNGYTEYRVRDNKVYEVYITYGYKFI